MDLVSSINFGITIGLGILSISLGIFSVVLSLFLSNSTNKALNSIKELTNDIKSLANNTLFNQQKYSDKMLDTIIEQSKYGKNENTYTSNIKENAIKMITKEIKEDISAQIKVILNDFKQSSSIPKQLINNLEDKIENTEINFNSLISRIELPDKIKLALKELSDFPAFYILIRGILLGNANNVNELTKISEKYFIPDGWDKGAINKLISIGILEGDNSKFNIPENIKLGLSYWIEINKNAYNKLLEYYSKKKEKTVSKEELNISKNDFLF